MYLTNSGYSIDREVRRNKPYAQFGINPIFVRIDPEWQKVRSSRHCRAAVIGLRFEKVPGNRGANWHRISYSSTLEEI
ncbi:MAG: hypothetical protein CMO55_23395 [Verrucomicrobiales bacterium]|nr:hypothetical protein [Verrucomicrobiales bacterium]